MLLDVFVARFPLLKKLSLCLAIILGLGFSSPGKAQAMTGEEIGVYIAAAGAGVLLLDKIVDSKFMRKIGHGVSTLWRGVKYCASCCCSRRERPSIMAKYFPEEMKEEHKRLLENLGRHLHRDVEAAVNAGQEAVSESIEEQASGGVTFVYNFPSCSIVLHILSMVDHFQNQEDYLGGLAATFKPITDEESIIRKVYSHLDIPDFRNKLNEIVQPPEYRHVPMSRLQRILRNGELKVLEREVGTSSDDPQTIFLVGVTSRFESQGRPVFVPQVHISETRFGFGREDLDAAAAVATRSSAPRDRALEGDAGRGVTLSEVALEEGHSGGDRRMCHDVEQGPPSSDLTAQERWLAMAAMVRGSRTSGSQGGRLFAPTKSNRGSGLSSSSSEGSPDAASSTPVRRRGSGSSSLEDRTGLSV